MTSLAAPCGMICMSRLCRNKDDIARQSLLESSITGIPQCMVRQAHHDNMVVSLITMKDVLLKCYKLNYYYFVWIPTDLSNAFFSSTVRALVIPDFNVSSVNVMMRTRLSSFTVYPTF